MNDAHDNDKNGEMRVRRIKNGTVIDHIPAGEALNVLKILGIDGSQPMTVSVVMNVDSKALGRKDIVKIEDRELKPKEIDKISLIAPTATYNIIRGYMVVKKQHVTVPKILEGIVRCENPRCITNTEEPVMPRAEVISKNPLKIKCLYCGRYIEDISSHII